RRRVKGWPGEVFRGNCFLESLEYCRNPKMLISNLLRNVRKTPRVCSDARSPSKSAHFFLLPPRYPPPASMIGRTDPRRVTWGTKCFQFFRIQKTEVMLIDDRNIAEIHVKRFFSEVAAAYSASRKKKTLAAENGTSVAGK
ncbi:hypothetical protein CEXT_366751, partial [Caerostris extrusa]